VIVRRNLGIDLLDILNPAERTPRHNPVTDTHQRIYIEMPDPVTTWRSHLDITHCFLEVERPALILILESTIRF
jgi:hypothetical protein